MDLLPEISAQVMLGEIQSESLHHLLTSVRNNASSPGSTQIPALDTCLQGLHPPESANKSLRWGDVVEIQGPSASGKTHFIYHFVITCILPSEHPNLKHPGWGKFAVVYDADATFDICRLHSLLLNRLTSLLPDEDVLEVTPPPDVEQLAQHCLENLYIFRPTTSHQLATSLLRLPDLILNQKPSQQLELGLVAVDSLSAFHWKDRLALEQLREAQSSQPVSPLRHVLTALQQIRISHAPILLLSNWALNPLTKPESPSHSAQSSLFYKQHLFPFPTPFAQSSASVLPSDSGTATNNTTAVSTRPSPFPIPAPGDLFAMEAALPLPLTYHITLSAINLPPFPASLSLVEACEQEDSRRRRVESLGEVQGLIRTPQSTKIGRFTFQIQDHAIGTTS